MGEEVGGGARWAGSERGAQGWGRQGEVSATPVDQGLCLAIF